MVSIGQSGGGNACGHLLRPARPQQQYGIAMTVIRWAETKPTIAQRGHNQDHRLNNAIARFLIGAPGAVAVPRWWSGGDSNCRSSLGFLDRGRPSEIFSFWQGLQ
jgi:hypothetical protein